MMTEDKLQEYAGFLRKRLETCQQKVDRTRQLLKTTPTDGVHVSLHIYESRLDLAKDYLSEFLRHFPELKKKG